MDNLSIEQIEILRNYAATIPKFTYKFVKTSKIIYISIWKNNQEHKVTIRGFCGEFPNRLRGYQFDLVWIDELLKIRNAANLIDQVNLCLRLGDSKCIITTTPIANDRLIKQICDMHKTYITTGPSYNNRGLSNTFYNFIEKCNDQVLLKQEIEGDVGVSYLWNNNNFIHVTIPECQIYRIGLDMAVTTGTVGIVLVGIENNRIYVINDYGATSLNWIYIIKELINKYYPIEIMYETNQGGNLIPSLLALHNIRCYSHGIHITKSKKHRHADLHLYYQMKLIYHSDNVTNLENEMLLYKKYDRIDALWCCMYNISNLIYLGEI